MAAALAGSHFTTLVILLPHGPPIRPADGTAEKLPGMRGRFLGHTYIEWGLVRNDCPPHWQTDD